MRSRARELLAAIRARAWRRGASTALAALAAFGGVPDAGEPASAPLTFAEPTGEYKVKAAFLYNFARHVKWPESAFSGPDAPLSIAIVGADPFGDALPNALKGKTANGRRIVLVHFESVAKLGPCHLLFLAPGLEGEIARVRAHYESRPVLVVADALEPVERGAQIGFFVERAKVRFAIAPAALRAANLQAGSELLKLARIVEPRPAEPLRTETAR